jgi:hypothetical protein
VSGEIEQPNDGQAAPASSGVQRRLKRFPIMGAVFILLGGFTWLNLTGFCYSQFRYVSDEELIEKALMSDWREIMELSAQKNPDKKSVSMSQFLRNTRVWGRVDGRNPSEAFSMDTGDAKPHYPPRAYRFFGLYYAFVAIVFDVGVGKEPYRLWGHVFDKCSYSYSAGYSDSANNREHLLDNWGLRRVTEINEGVSISHDELIPAEKLK